MKKILISLCLILLLVQDARPALEYGLEWDGTGSVRRMLYWDTPPSSYPMTYIFRVLPCEKTSGMYRYFTTFFWGNNGIFAWDTGGAAHNYYGGHPYPVPPADGAQQWEVSTYQHDYTTGEEVDWDRWHIQAFIASISGMQTHHSFYYDLPDTDALLESTDVQQPANWLNIPPSPAIVMGQAPDNGMGASWGGYPGWEEFCGVIRGIQIYEDDLTLTEIADEIDSPLSSTASGDIWYLNLNPRPSDVADDSGNGNDPAWDGVTAAEWVGGTPDPAPSRMRLRK